MPMQGAATLQEYLISLGVQMDTGAMSQLMSFLTSGKVKAAAMGAAFTAAGKAIYGFLKSSYDAEQEMQKMAKTQHKSVETIRAQQNALKAMGKTMQEVSKDPALKAMYNDLVKANKAMALPDMRGGISLLRQLQASFYELRAAVRYSMQWINYHMLANLKEPIQRITAFFKQVAEFIRKDINGLTAKLASYLTAFTKGLLGIVEMSVKIADWVHKLPDGIKSAGLAVTAVFALLKSGPLGQIMAVITAVGGLIDDYENWKWNKANPDAEQVAVAFPSIWELLDSDDPEKIQKITKLITDQLSNSLADVSFDLATWMNSHRDEIEAGISSFLDMIAEMIEGASTVITAIAKFIGELATDPEVLDAAKELGAALFKAIVAGLSSVGGGLIGGILKGIFGEDSDVYKSWDAAIGETTTSILTGESATPTGVNENGAVIDSVTMAMLKRTDPTAYQAALSRSETDWGKAVTYVTNSSGLDYGQNKNYPNIAAYQKVRQNLTPQAPANLGKNQPMWDALMRRYNAAKNSQDAESFMAISDIVAGFQKNYGEKAGGISGFFGSADVSEVLAQTQASLDAYDKGLTVNATVSDNAGKQMVETLQSQVDSAGTVSVGVSFKAEGGGGGSRGLTFTRLQNAWGGRYDRPITTEIAEDGGTEYIIPLSKPARAFALIKQMLGEMGSAATQRLMTDMGLGMAGTNGASAATISAAASGATINNTYNISAPVTIQVTASGADAKEIGTTAYNAAQRQLIRSLKGVLA